MRLLIEELEELSIELKNTRDRLAELKRMYRKFYDRDLRREIDEKIIHLKELKSKLNKLLYANLEELRLIKLNFNKFYKELEEDPYLSSGIKRISWLLEFEELHPDKALKEMEKTKFNRIELRNIKYEILKFSKVKYKELGKYSILKNILKKKPKRDELLKWIYEKDKELKKQGWLILLNEPFVDKYIKNLLEVYRMNLNEEKDIEHYYKQARNKGTFSESEIMKDLEKAKKQRIHAEKKCRHILLANPLYLRKLKSSKRFHPVFSIFELKFIDSIEMKNIKQDEWKKQMKKVLS